MPAERLRRQGGFSLVELVVTIVIMAILFAGLAVLFFDQVRHSPQPVIATRAAELGQAYLDEILTKRYDERSGQGGMPRCNSTDPGSQPCSAALGPEAGESRATYDDVDDYNGLDESPPRDALGNVRSGYANYRVQVSVAYAGTGANGLGLATVQDAKLITVTVTTPQGEKIDFSAYRVNY